MMMGSRRLSCCECVSVGLDIPSHHHWWHGVSVGWWCWVLAAFQLLDIMSDMFPNDWKGVKLPWW